MCIVKRKSNVSIPSDTDRSLVLYGEEDADFEAIRTTLRGPSLFASPRNVCRVCPTSRLRQISFVLRAASRDVTRKEALGWQQPPGYVTLYVTGKPNTRRDKGGFKLGIKFFSAEGKVCRGYFGEPRDCLFPVSHGHRFLPSSSRIGSFTE